MNTREEWTRFATSIEAPSAMWLNGQWFNGDGSERHHVLSPHDDTVVTSVPLATHADVDRAVEGARAAFLDGRWARISAPERGPVIQGWA